MRRVHWAKYIIRLTLLCASVVLFACIPLKWDNPAKDKMKQLESKPLKKIEVHELFGEPIIGLDEWNVEVYEFPGGESKFVGFSAVPGPVFILPEGVITEKFTGYLLLVYDNDLVKSSDYGSDKGDTKLDAEGFTYEVKNKILLAPYNNENKFINYEKEGIKCSIYLLSYTDIIFQGIIYINDKYIGQANYSNGYLLYDLGEGDHSLRLRYMDYENYKKNKTWFNNILVKFNCYKDSQLYFQIKKNDLIIDDKKYVIIVSEQKPDDLSKRRQIIFQATPEWENQKGYETIEEN